MATLVNIISHLHEAEGASRILLIDRNFSPLIAELVQHQHVRQPGWGVLEMPDFIERRAPEAVKATALAHLDEIYQLTGAGGPLGLRLLLGLLLDFEFGELLAMIDVREDDQGVLSVKNLVAFAI